MSWLSAIKSVGSLAGAALRSPLGSVVKALPLVGSVATVAGLGLEAYSAFGPSTPKPSGGLPALPPVPGGGFGGGASGGGGAMAVAPSAPQQVGAHIPAGMRPVMIPANGLRQFVRAPRGYHVFHTPSGPIGIRKDVARMYAAQNGLPMPHAHHRPPITVGQWHALKKAHHVIKVLHKVNKMAHTLPHTGKHKALPAPQHHPKKK